MSQIGPTELIIILVIVLLVFGVGKLPEVGSALGRGIKEFKAATKEVEEAKKDLENTLPKELGVGGDKPKES
ncbi:MAG: twin-arginine translocase TatA/TatE family subunit [Chloroflexota bacterium]